MHNECGLSKIIEAIPNKYTEMFQCKEFANYLMKKMMGQGINGELLVLKSETPYIWSNTFNQSITRNGDHVAVKVGNMVYDNLFPKGIQYSKWLQDLEVGSHLLPPPTVTPF